LIDRTQIQQIRENLQTKRQFGNIHFDIQSKREHTRGDDKSTIDAYVISLGFNPIGDHWDRIDSQRTGEIIAELFQYCIPYKAPGDEIMPPAEAKSTALELLKILPTNARFYTKFDKHWHDGNAIVTQATFNTGIIFTDDQQIGIFWVDDED
jgi:hypothetical protein